MIIPLVRLCLDGNMTSQSRGLRQREKRRVCDGPLGRFVSCAQSYSIATFWRIFKNGMIVWGIQMKMFGENLGSEGKICVGWVGVASAGKNARVVRVDTNAS